MISKNTVIGFLVFSAVVLACVLVLQVGTTPPAAQAAVMTRFGAYAMTTALLDNDRDLLWMLDTRTDQLMVYEFDRKGRVVPLAVTDVKSAFETEKQAETSRSRRRRR